MKPEPLQPFAQELLDRERAQAPSLTPSTEDVERLLKRLDATITAAPIAATPSLGAFPIAKVGASVGVAVVVVGTLVMLGFKLLALQPAPPLDSKSAPEPSVGSSTSAPNDSPRASTPLPAPPPVPSAVSVPAPPGVGPRPPRRVAEHVLLDAARSAIMTGQTDSALGSLARHAQRFPNGELAEEREALVVQALARSGDLNGARERADSFRRRYPHSIFLTAVDAASPP